MIPNEKRKMLDLDAGKRMFWSQDQLFEHRYFQCLIVYFNIR